ncbi:hypothetical protein L1049_007969 [Liquidambar formosana]|uniref:F-box domain-containing protein n=1 Tax=Liquidambar formosana TaxID=63359 RepID=A0AAP0X1Z8_LIQFO
MAPPSTSPTPTGTIAGAAASDVGASTTISAVHPDILSTHILTLLDGPTLASASCASSTLHALSSDHRLWSHICQSTWPSTTTDPRLLHLISGFPPTGPRSFFSSSFPLLLSDPTAAQKPHRPSPPPPPELISAVDIHYRGNLIFSKVQETETVTGWFRCSPFRVDLLDPKDVVMTPIQHPDGDDTCRELSNDLSLSWILIDPIGRRAVNLSSYKPVHVQRHWLTGEVQVRYSSILAVDHNKGSSSEFVQCGIVVTCGGSEGGEMQVREVSLQAEDMDGMHLNGKDSLVVLQTAFEGKRLKRGRSGEVGRKRYEDFLAKKRERRERKARTEGRLDMMCVAFGVSIFAAFWIFVLCT